MDKVRTIIEKALEEGFKETLKHSKTILDLRKEFSKKFMEIKSDYIIYTHDLFDELEEDYALLLDEIQDSELDNSSSSI